MTPILEAHGRVKRILTALCAIIATFVVALTAPAQMPFFMQPQKAWVSPKPMPAIVRVRLDTSAGPIVIALDMKRAPITATNFLRYVEEKRFDGTSFYRAARNPTSRTTGLVQGGIDHNMPRSWFPIGHEPTTLTGIKHVDGTISMARNEPGTAMGDFFICVGPAQRLDAVPGNKILVGYAAFGHVVTGMDVIHRILALPTWPGGRTRELVGQSIRQPVRIIRATRIG
jgi:peptidyl-prolyl cis-trans isomerase A (cyclophilin A)